MSADDCVLFAVPASQVQFRRASAFQSPQVSATQPELVPVLVRVAPEQQRRR